MSVQWIAAAAVVALAAAIATWRRARSLRGGWRDRIVWLQPLVALALLLALFPPEVALRAGALTVLTPGATPAQVRALPVAERVVALPGAPVSPRAERVPDLGTALRRFEDTRNVNVVGGGLPARDAGQAAGVGLAFDAAPAHGLVDLYAPARVPAGTQWAVGGRVAAPGVSLELADPSGDVVASARPDALGAFRLAAAARAAGPARFELRVLGPQREVLERASVPVVAEAGATLSVIVRAGAPDPELKYVRRWAADAGLDVRAAARLSPEVALRDGDAGLTPEALAAADLVVIDERAWLALMPDEKIALDGAVRAGLGLLLRIAGPVDAAVAADWRRLGFDVANEDAPRTVTLDRALALVTRTAFTVAPARVDAADAAPIVRADDGEALASWRPYGDGRVGVWTLVDSFDLVLLGDAARHGTLWSDVVGTLARARPAAPRPRLPDVAWVDERAVICAPPADAPRGSGVPPRSALEDGDPAARGSGVPPRSAPERSDGVSLRIRAPDGVVTPLIADAGGCAAYWPAMPGWHRLDGADGDAFYVRATDDGASLRAARDARETASRVRPARDVEAAVTARVPLPRWPFFLLWLCAATMLWWRERTSTSFSS
jgi:hypothetical protein